MMSATEMIAASMPELRTWIGRRQVVEDDIALTTVRRIAAMLDLEPDRFVAGMELPRHWFSMFFHNNAMQRDIGPDGHPNKGSLSCPHSSAPPYGGRPSREDHGFSPGLRAGEARRRGGRRYPKDGPNGVNRGADHAPYH